MDNIDESGQTGDTPQKKVVLVVDDENCLTGSIKNNLEHSDGNFHVDCASSGNEAIRIIKGGKDPDAILSDLLMPDGTGVDLYRWLEIERPNLVSRIIFMTACSGAFEQFIKKMELQGRLLDKPFDVDVMREKIEAVLAGKLTDLT